MDVDLSGGGGGGAAPADGVFALSVRLLTLAGVWPPPDDSPELTRWSYAGWNYFMLALSVVSTLGEIGGMLFVEAPMTARANNFITSLWRLLGLCIVLLLRSRVRALQVLAAGFERMARMRHADYGFGDVDREVAALQQRVRRIIKRVIVVFMGWFLYSSVGVVMTPWTDWLETGVRPKPFLASKFWLLGQPDTLTKEMLAALTQNLNQFTCTLVYVSYMTMYAGMAIFLSYQAKIVGVLIKNVPFAASTACTSSERRVKERLEYCIHLHQDVLDSAMDLNRLGCLFILVLFSVSLCFMGVMLFLISAQSDGNSFLVATFMILVCTNSMVGLITYSSDALNSANEEVVSAVMASDWCSATPALQRLVYIMVMRATKAPWLWCWRFFRIGLPTWLTMLNKSYSVYAVMRTSTDK